MKPSKPLKFKQKRIVRQLSIYMIALIISVLLLVFIMNSLLLGRVYLKDKEKAMISAFQTLNSASADGSLYSDTYRTTFSSLCANDNLSAIVISANGSLMLSSAGSEENESIVQQLIDTVINNVSDNDAIASGDNYVLQSGTYQETGEEYLLLWGTLDDANTILIRCPIESLKGAVEVTNHFLIIVGLIAGLLAVAASEIIANYILKPVLELTNLSEKMSNLEFEKRYQVRENGNEIDVLGTHMNAMADNLEHAIKDLQSANATLEEDLKQKEEAEQLRKEFLSNVTHELKTPIALIQGYAEGLSEGIADNPEDMKYYCDVIIDESERMNRMVKELLSLNQLESGKFKAEMEEFNLCDLIHGVIAATKVMIDQYQADVCFECDRDYMVYADEFFTEQVVTNYLTNAIHYAKGDKKIIISLENNQKNVRLKVYNRGEQIPKEAISHVFEKFYKVDKARTREYGGSGIGLSVVKAIAESFHKNYGVYNEADGVTFWFDLDKK